MGSSVGVCEAHNLEIRPSGSKSRPSEPKISLILAQFGPKLQLEAAKWNEKQSISEIGGSQTTKKILFFHNISWFLSLQQRFPQGISIRVSLCLSSKVS